jgi:hypothetical protein
MTTVTTHALANLYAEDETAWLETMAALAKRRETAKLDWANLSEYLTDMANRDRREVKSRLVVLLAHLLKWQHQPDRRAGGWRATIIEQRQRLADEARRGVLRSHAEWILSEAYAEAIELAIAETGLPRGTFPEACPYDLNELLTIDVQE